MKTKFILSVIIIAITTACASTRTMWSDKNMRVMVDPESIDEDNYNNILQALVQSDKFTVVDRARGWKAVKKEQERLHTSNEASRYDNKEKYAMYARLFGVGSIIVANSQCLKTGAFLSAAKSRLSCRQSLYMVDANTGSIITAANGENIGPSAAGNDLLMPDWNVVVDKLVEAYPKNFEHKEYAQELKDYRKESQEEAEKMQQRTPAANH